MKKNLAYRCVVNASLFLSSSLPLLFYSFTLYSFTLRCRWYIGSFSTKLPSITNQPYTSQDQASYSAWVCGPNVQGPTRRCGGGGGACTYDHFSTVKRALFLREDDVGFGTILGVLSPIFSTYPSRPRRGGVDGGGASGGTPCSS